MKAAIIFYSYTGNTRAVAHYLKETLSSILDTETELVEAKPESETDNFFKQSIRAIRKGEPVLKKEVKYDLGSFDLVFFGSPVWAFNIAPGVRSYFKQAYGLKNKRAVCFVTCGSSLGADKALGQMQALLRAEGSNPEACLIIKDSKSKDKEYLGEKFKAVLGSLQ